MVVNIISLLIMFSLGFAIGMIVAARMWSKTCNDLASDNAYYRTCLTSLRNEVKRLKQR